MVCGLSLAASLPSTAADTSRHSAPTPRAHASSWPCTLRARCRPETPACAGSSRHRAPLPARRRLRPRTAPSRAAPCASRASGSAYPLVLQAGDGTCLRGRHRRRPNACSARSAAAAPPASSMTASSPLSVAPRRPTRHSRTSASLASAEARMAYVVRTSAVGPGRGAPRSRAIAAPMLEHVPHLSGGPAPELRRIDEDYVIALAAPHLARDELARVVQDPADGRSPSGDGLVFLRPARSPFSTRRRGPPRHRRAPRSARRRRCRQTG